MLMDLRSGTIKINDELVIHPQYFFEHVEIFKKNSLKEKLSLKRRVYN